jgi:uncharacterized membrane protein
MIFRKKILNSSEEQMLLEAIKEAENKTSGEIRVHIEYNAKGDVVELCKKKFEELKMHETKDRNGILFYLAVKTKSFAVWGDEGIHQKVSQDFWDSITNLALLHFKNGNYVDGLKSAIYSCGEQLKTHFPIQADDKDELTNEISY